MSNESDFEEIKKITVGFAQLGATTGAYSGWGAGIVGGPMAFVTAATGAAVGGVTFGAIGAVIGTTAWAVDKISKSLND